MGADLGLTGKLGNVQDAEPGLRYSTRVHARTCSVCSMCACVLTLQVRFVLKDDIRRQLDSGNIVLLSNIGGRGGVDEVGLRVWHAGGGRGWAEQLWAFGCTLGPPWPRSDSGMLTRTR